jgi:hypothetical protein
MAGGTSIRHGAVRLILAIALVAATARAASADYEYKLFQYSTSEMGQKVGEFATTNPGWEIVSMTDLTFQDRGSVSILLLARREVAPPANPRTEVPGTLTSDPRVQLVAAPVWATSSGYAHQALARVASAFSAPPARSTVRLTALIDVVIDESGSVKYAGARAGKVDKALADAALAAIAAVGSFGAIPTGGASAELNQRSFTFSFKP